MISWIALGLGAILVLTFTLPFAPSSLAERTLGIAALGAILGLALTNSKWAWHLSTLTVPAGIALVLLIRACSRFQSESLSSYHPFGHSQRFALRHGQMALALSATLVIETGVILAIRFRAQFDILPTLSSLYLLWIFFALVLLLVRSVKPCQISPSAKESHGTFPHLRTQVTSLIAVIAFAVAYVASEPQYQPLAISFPNRIFQNIAGLVSPDVRCNYSDRLLGTHTPNMTLNNSVVAPPFAMPFFPCARPPEKSTFLWKNPGVARIEKYGSQSILSSGSQFSEATWMNR